MFRTFVVAVVFAGSACITINERCRFVTEHVPRPPMPEEFAAVDRALLRWALSSTLQCRKMQGAYSLHFRINFAEKLLPDLCQRLERARSFAAGGSLREAGRSYQSLLVASQVAGLTVTTMAVAEYADAVGMPTPKIDAILEAFAAQMQPVLDAALQEDPRVLERVLEERGPAFAEWIAFLERWSARMEREEARLEVARRIWDVAMLAAAAHQALGALGRMSPPPMVAVGTGGAVAIARAGPVPLELVEAIRKLLASGVLDAGVMVGLSRMVGGGAGVPNLTALQMSGSSSPTCGPAPARGGSAESAKAVQYPDPDGLADLARFREQIGMPKGKGTLARLEVGGRTFYGISAHGQEVSLQVNAWSQSHAEVDAFEQAARGGVRGGRARMFVDRKLCGACGRNGGVRSMVKQLGLEQLEVITPEGTRVILP